MASLIDDFDAQVALMRKTIERVETRGYYITFAGLNTDAADNRYLYSFLSGGMAQFIEARLKLYKRRPVKIVVWLPDEGSRTQPDTSRASAIKSGKLFDAPFWFKLTIPDRAAYRPMLACLEMMSRMPDRGSRGRNSTYSGAGFLTADKVASRVEFTGAGRDAFETVLRVLDVPQHRDVMLGAK